MRRIHAALVLLFASAAPASDAQETSPLIGQRVVIKYKSPLTVGGVAVEPKDYRAFVVDRADGNWLWLVSGGVSGWMARDEVLTLDEAIDFYTAELQRNPSAWNAYLYRAFVWDVKRQYDKAIADYTSAIAIYPLWANTFNNRGWTYHRLKQYDKAIADYVAALKLDPRHVLATINRGFAWQDKGDYYKAINDFRRAVKLDPIYGRAHAALGWLYSTCSDPKFRDGKLALASAKKACDITKWREAGKLAVLAAAYAESGEFDKAVRWQQEAVSRFVDPEDRRTGGDRLALYKDKKPFRVLTAVERGRHEHHGPQSDPFAAFPDPERAGKIFAELEERLGKPEAATEHDREKKLSAEILLLSRKHHMRQREIRAIYEAGSEKDRGTSDEHKTGEPQMNTDEHR